jgi:iron complex transport system substrate-binding protein
VEGSWVTSNEALIDVVLTLATEVHRAVGPGLLESAYCAALSFELSSHEVPHEVERPVPFFYRGERLGVGFRADMIVDSQLLVEIKSTKQVDAAHFRQVKTYLTMLRMRTGLILNFGFPLLRDGIRRITVSPRSPPPREDPPSSPRSPWS